MINVINFNLRLINFVYFFETPGTFKIAAQNYPPNLSTVKIDDRMEYVTSTVDMSVSDFCDS